MPKQSIDKLLRNDAAEFLKELDDPEEWRQWFTQIIKQVEREGLGETEEYSDDQP